MTQTARPGRGHPSYRERGMRDATIRQPFRHPPGPPGRGRVDTVDLARQFGAPLYVVDEDQLRANCRTYVQALAEAMPQGPCLFARQGPVL